MGAFDIVVLAVIGISTILGLWKGMVRQVFGLLGVIAGYALAMRFYQPGAKVLTSFHPFPARAVSFIAIFLACIVAAHLIGWAVGRFFSGSKLGFLNRIFGGFLGFLKGCTIVCIAVMVITAFLPAKHSLFRKSSTIRHILSVTAALKKVTRQEIKAKYNEKTGAEEPVPQRHR